MEKKYQCIISIGHDGSIIEQTGENKVSLYLPKTLSVDFYDTLDFIESDVILSGRVERIQWELEKCRAYPTDFDFIFKDKIDLMLFRKFRNNMIKAGLTNEEYINFVSVLKYQHLLLEITHQVCSDNGDTCKLYINSPITDSQMFELTQKINWTIENFNYGTNTIQFEPDEKYNKPLTPESIRLFIRQNKSDWAKMNFITLDNGDRLINDYGKFSPELSFILSPENMYEWWIFLSPESATKKFNMIFDGSVSILYGDYWKSKKGTNCFRPAKPEDAKHVLIRNNWGGSYTYTQSIEYDKFSKNPVVEYSMRSTSKNGNTGASYYIVDKDWRQTISLEDI